MAYRNPIEDELAIRDVTARYIDAVNRRDEAALAPCWAENATWFLLGQEITGRDNIMDFWRSTMDLFEFVVMTQTAQTMDIKDKTASGRVYITEFFNMKNVGPNMVLGVYDDEYTVGDDGQWRIAMRNYHVFYQGPTDLSGEYQPYPA